MRSVQSTHAFLCVTATPFSRPRFHSLLRLPLICVLLLAVIATAAPAQMVISEFMAANSRTLTDEDRDDSDWIELYNSGSAPVDLDGWHLTDDPSHQRKWRFPATILPPSRYLVVFASNKNRNASAAPLHTNFRLSTGGDYLALLKPDGAVAFAFAPKFPPQVTDVSYGFPMHETMTPLISSGSSAKLFVPLNEALDTMWADVDWPDRDWTEVMTGIGFEDENAPATPLIIADSIADFSSIQGQNNWFYGYYNRTSDTAAGYAIDDFTVFPNRVGPPGPANFWNGTSWDWFQGDPPWTEIGPRFMHPNGLNNGAEHWAIRRWVSPVSGTLTIEWRLAKQNPNGSGVTGRVYHQATQRDQSLIQGANLDGVTRKSILREVNAGDFIDFALAPTGGASAGDDLGDGSFMSATITVTNALTAQINTRIAAPMRDLNSSVYLRIPFVSADPSAFEFLKLRMKYDDGFIAYLNGVEVASRNAPDNPAWNSSATASRNLAEAIRFEEIDLTDRLGLIHPGTNVLAVHGLNAGNSDPDFLIVPELIASSLAIDSATGGYFSSPTPGRVNGVGNAKLGPLVVDTSHSPRVPAGGQNLVVTARAVQSFDPVKQLALSYRIMWGAEKSIPMADDGKNGDGLAGDGVFGATIPSDASASGQMIRYYISATDAAGHTSRWPPFSDPRNSPEYYGTMVATNVTSALPVLHWFIRSRTAADTETGARCSVFFQDEFYDNVLVKLHGQSSRSFPKKSYDFDFNSGRHFRYSPDERTVEDFNLLTTYPDKSHLRNLLAYQTYRDAGSSYHVAFAIRVQQNGAFFSDAHFVEDGDEDYLARLGLDPLGALYKMYNVLDSATSGAEKKTRKHEGNADLQALITGLRRTGAARRQFIYDHVNIPAMVNYLAAMIVTGGVDCCHKNYYAYRDTNGTGEWQYLPWDVDLTFGRNWNSANTYYDDTMHYGNPLFVGSNNTLISALFGTPAIRQMYLRRVRTLMDDLLQPTNTPPAQLKFEGRIDELARLIGPDAALDFAKWPTWGQRQTLSQAVDILTNLYFPRRRNYLYKHRDVPLPQPQNLTLTIAGLEFNPNSGNQDEEFVQISNTNKVPVDISGWRLAGAVSHVFHPGTVLPTNSSIYVSPNAAAFRNRTTAPKGGQTLFVQGNYSGQLSARGESLQVLDLQGRQVASSTYTGAPTPAQQFLRITEIMFHPAPPAPGAAFATEDFEFIQLKNIGSTALDLTGVRFSAGISFHFDLSTATLLLPGETVYVVKNAAAFDTRYGRGFNVAGAYEGHLENRGENLRLDDGAGEKILDFDYRNDWSALTDGQGFSLVMHDASGPWNTWGDRSRWRPSALANGSPASQPSPLAQWRAAHFTPQEIANLAIGGDSADPDLDGRDNYDEFVSGTDPRDASSCLTIQTLRITPGENTAATMQFQTAIGKSYSVLYAESLARPIWRKLRDIPATAEARVLELSDPLGPNHRARYYRIVTPLQP